MSHVYGHDDVLRRGLREIVAARNALDALESQLVADARARGYKWPELAEDLGLTPQGARKRHLDVDPIYARRRRPEPPIDVLLAELIATIRRGRTRR